MAARGRPASALAVQFSPNVWEQVGRLSRDAFAAIQMAVEQQARDLGDTPDLPEAGDLAVLGYEVHYEVDDRRRLMLISALRRSR